MYILLVASAFASLTLANMTNTANVFIRQDVGCDLLPCATSDCDLIPCGDPGWGVVSDCACCGGQVGCNIPLGHTCGTQNGEPVCFTGSGGGASSAVASASSSAAAPFASSSSSSPPTASSSSPAGSDSGSVRGSTPANKNGATPLRRRSGCNGLIIALGLALGFGYVLLL